MTDTSLIYPYEFQGGQKAVASEVNANFEAVKMFANSVNLVLNEINGAIDDLKNKPTREVLDIYYSFSSKTPTGAYPLWTGETITHCKNLFPQFWKLINDLSAQGNLPTVSSEEYENRLSEYGQCASFYIDKLNGHVRLPKITTFVSSIAGLNELAKEQKAGLPDIVGTLDRVAFYDGGVPTSSSAFSLVKTGAASTSSVGRTSHATVTFRASDTSGNQVYGKSTTVQPPAVKLCLYIQVANNTAELSELDTSVIAQKLQDAVNSLQESYNQYTVNLNSLYEVLHQNVMALSPVLKIKNKSVSPQDFFEDDTYEEYPYAADVEVEQADTLHVPTVCFNLKEVCGDMLGQISYAGNGYVRIYANRIPEEEFVIPTILLQ